MNLALWRKAVSAAWLQLVVCSVLLVVFGWVFVWLMGLFKVGAWVAFLEMLPGFSRRLMGIPVSRLATPAGQISFLYVHVVTILMCVGWAVGRGSDPISGEISRGTMDLTLTLPVWRTTIIVIPAVVAVLGGIILVGSVWVGNWLGLLIARPGENISARQFIPGAVNLFAMTFCLTGLTTFISSWNRDRWRTALITVAFFVVSFIIKMIARLWEPGEWLKYLSFLSAFHPQRLILMPDEAWSLSLSYNTTLIGLGLTGYAAGAIVFSRRDIPSAL